MNTYFKYTLNILLVVSISIPVSCALAAEVVLDGLVRGMGSYSKEIQSIRERRFEYVIEQKTDFSCGAASLASILKFAYGMDEVTEQSVLLGMLESADIEVVKQQGFSLLDMKHFLISRKFRGRGYNINNDELKLLKIPAIVLLNDTGYHHFVVLRRVEDGLIYLGDPALGNRIMRLEEFVEKWNQVVFVVIGQEYDKQNPLLQPRARLTYRTLSIPKPLTDAELMEFGFAYSDML
ncbi:MAG: C39 family peptidase [Shewanella sp.]